MVALGSSADVMCTVSGVILGVSRAVMCTVSVILVLGVTCAAAISVWTRASETRSPRELRSATQGADREVQFCQFGRIAARFRD
jgi:ABC-type phosphate transport system permease subunit